MFMRVFNLDTIQKINDLKGIIYKDLVYETTVFVENLSSVIYTPSRTVLLKGGFIFWLKKSFSEVADNIRLLIGYI